MVDKLVFSTDEAGQALNLSRPSVYALMNRANDPLPNFRAGNRRLVPVESLREWVRRQAEGGNVNVQV